MEIPSRDITRQYELTYLVPGTMTSADVSKVTSDVESQLKKLKFTVLKQEEWGKKNMAYPIRHAGARNYEAQYFHLVVEGDADRVQSLESAIRLNQSIMRHLLVVANDASETTHTSEDADTKTASADDDTKSKVETKEEAS